MSEFHFIRPWWLLGLIPIIVIFLYAWRHANQNTGWSRFLPAHLHSILIPQQADKNQRWPLLLLAAALSLATFAVAGPTWQRLPQPVFQLQAGHVLIMDMSRSVYSTDVSPNRLTQMRFKATDLAREKVDGDIGLVAYANDAFTISPLTPDGANLTNLIRALSPEIMPNQGSYPLRALELADQLLAASGYSQGQIFWFTDGIDSRDQQELADFIGRTQHRLNILAIGTPAGAPITLPDGRLLRDTSGNVVIPKLIAGPLEALAKQSGGRFSLLTADQADLDYLTQQAPTTRDHEDSAQHLQAGDEWLDQGPWLLPIVLLLLLPLARRGVLPMVVVVTMSGYLISPVYAQQQPLSWQQKLWQTPYQQADEALRDGDYERASEISEDPWQRGTANYRAQNYEQALMDFSQLDTAEGYYNQGNALMNLQRYDEAQNAYQAALQRRPNWQQAEDNLKLAQQLAEQQSQQQQNAAQDQQQSSQQQNQSGASNADDSDQQQSEEAAANEQQQPSEQQQQQEQEQEEQEQEGQQPDASEQREQPQPQPDSGEPASEELQQQMQQWLNRIEDDPAVLLRNKMRYEAEKRRRQGPPPGVEKQW